MSFEKILIKKNEGAIFGEIRQLQTQKDYFQKYVNKVIALGITVDENDLDLLFENPKSYITEKLTAGESMKVGSLNLNKEKLYELLEKPPGTNDLINEIEKDLMDRGTREFHIWTVNNFKINQNEVVLKDETVEFINIKHSIFINNQNQKIAFEKLQQIATLFNDLNDLDCKKIDLRTELSELMITNDKVFDNNIAFITVPLEEWTEVKSQLTEISKNLLELKGKNKSEFLTPKEVCELLKCSRNTFQSYIDKGFLEPIKMKTEKYSKLLVRRIDVDFYLQSRVNHS